MALNIKHPEADRLARTLARATGESLTEAVLTAIKERLQRETGRGDTEAVRRNIRTIQQRYAAKHMVDTRTADEIIGYDEHGLPT
ncbi:MAG TPA: type II toxin-antitoxin system VapB family antitoxin [Longimicrobiaceae bacterium]|nr:type II toxin-antitoxin system VapB family antitoxin [Longimicrobiaceae bacterium]